MAEMGYTNHTVEELVLFRARKALEAGCDGVIASGREARKIREISGDRLLVVTPGIRPEDYPGDDQKRRTTATQAILAGADFLVVGRPITDAANPNGSVNNIAGICSERRNVVGLMPHPERACEPVLGSGDGLVLLESVLSQVAAHGGAQTVAS